MVTLDGDNGNEKRVSPSLSLRVSASAVLGLVVQTVGVIYWLATMHGDVQHLKQEQAVQDHRIDAIDSSGSRALALAQQRLNDTIAINSAQDMRVRELETKISELQRNVIENKFWIDQMVQFIRQNAHPRPPGAIPP